MTTPSKSIGQLSRETGVKVPTIRFYEQIGLLKEPERTLSNRRVYGPHASRRLGFIRHARGLGFAIDDIRVLLDLADRPQVSCEEANCLAQAQLAATDRKIRQLTALRDELRRVATACAGGPSADCAVIEALTEATARPATANQA